MIYLDHNATTPVHPEVLDAMLPYLKEEFGNASGLYQLGQRARKAVEEARHHVARLMGADDASEIIFTSGGTESNNMAIKGVVSEHAPKGRRVVSSAIEHSSVRTVLQILAKDGLIDNVVVAVESNGILAPQSLNDAITPDTVLVSVMGANNEVGTLQPVEEISHICRNKNVLFHCDAVQMAGKTPIQVNQLGVDLLSLSAHKFGGPKGVGALYVRKGTRLKGLIQGGRQERNRRGGTENVAGIVGMGKAAQMAMDEMETESKRLSALRNSFENQLSATVPKCFVNGEKSKRTCNTTNICFEYTENSGLLMALDLRGVACSSGSACAAGSPDPSHVLLAMGLPQEKAHASLRFSLGHTTTEGDIIAAVKIIAEVVQSQRSLHPLWKKAVNE